MAKLAHSSFALDLLRRLLCAHSARGGGTGIAQPRGDDGAAAALRNEKMGDEGASPARSPCIVARLMGLDAMPPSPPQPMQLRRSRSASSAEGLSPPPPTPCGSPPPPTPCGSPPPRVARMTSASFTDRPTYLRRENDEFLLLSFSPDDAGDGGEAAAIAGRKQRREHRRRRHGEPGRSRRRPAAEEGCALQNSSPVSVLDAQDESSTTTTTSSSSLEEVEQAEHCSPSSDGGEIRPAPSQPQGSRRKLLQPPFDDLGGALPPELVVGTCSVSNCSSRDRRDRRPVNNAEAIAPAATGTWRIICRLVEDDICGMKWGARNGGNIAAEMESEILDQLISEETDQLMQLVVV